METMRIRPEMIFHPDRQVYEKGEIHTVDGLITAIGKELQPLAGEKILDLPGMILTPGWIDIHVHASPLDSVIGMAPDQVGILRGSPLVIDAGTVGTNLLETYLEGPAKAARTEVKILLNISRIGLKRLDEGSDPAWIDEEAIRRAVKKYPQAIVGIKARASASVVGDQGIGPIERAKAMASELALPLVVHIGNMPPKVEDVLDLMEAGDVITHCYHNKPNGLFDGEGHLIPAARAARNRGVLFDVGHGSASFSFEIAEKAMKQGFVADLISTDLYEKNIQGPVVSLSHVMDKMIHTGISLEDAISKVTHEAAKAFKLEGYGLLAPGAKAVFTAYKRVEQDVELVDSVNIHRVGSARFGTIVSIVDGECVNWEGLRCQKSSEK
jgi:dihydroorotase